jgi:hypothetical protein
MALGEKRSLVGNFYLARKKGDEGVHDRVEGAAAAMITSKELISRDRLQYQVLLGLSIAAMGLTGIIHFTDNHPFERFIGGINPLLAGMLIIISGGILFTFLLSRGWFAFYKTEDLTGLYRASGLAAVLGIIMILVDLKIIFPADMNIVFPASLLFYPAIGFFAEILFHVLPLTLLLFTLTSLFRNVRHGNILWISILIVALLEPVYQTIWMDGRYPPWAVAYVGLHVFLINLFQLVIFKRYDFISMYFFRLVYYLFWHIGWGYLRLRVLF